MASRSLGVQTSILSLRHAADASKHPWSYFRKVLPWPTPPRGLLCHNTHWLFGGRLTPGWSSSVAVGCRASAGPGRSTIAPVAVGVIPIQLACLHRFSFALPHPGSPWLSGRKRRPLWPHAPPLSNVPPRACSLVRGRRESSCCEPLGADAARLPPFRLQIHLKESNEPFRCRQIGFFVPYLTGEPRIRSSDGHCHLGPRLSCRHVRLETLFRKSGSVCVISIAAIAPSLRSGGAAYYLYAHHTCTCTRAKGWGKEAQASKGV